MTHGDFPPSSIDRPLRLSARRPHDRSARSLVSPVNEMQRHAGVRDERRAGRLADAVHDVEHAVGHARLGHDLRQQRRPTAASTRLSLSTTVQPDGQRRVRASSDSSMNGVFHGVISPATPAGLRST